MGQIVVAAAGAAIGAPFGMAGLGWFLGSIAGSLLFPPDPTRSTQQPLADLRIVGTEYGQPIPYVRGAALLAGQMWWNTDRRQTTTVTTSGGKGGEPEVETETITYDMDCLIGLTDNEIVGIARVFDQGRLVWTADSGATTESLAASAVTDLWDRMTVYTGSASQLPDPTYEAAVGTVNAMAYRGRGSVFIQGLKLGQSGNPRNLTFEVVVDGTLAIVDPGWTLRSGASTGPSAGEAICYGNGIFVAVGGGVVATSVDGLDTWEQQTAASANDWSDVCWAEELGLFVACSTNGTGDRIMTSPDGVAWTSRASAADYSWYGIAWNGVRFVCAGWTSNCQVSSDGINWSLEATSAGAIWTGIAWGDGTWVMVGRIGDSIQTSPTGLAGTWTNRSAAVPADITSPYRVRFNDGRFLAVSFEDDMGVMYSDNLGVSWISVAAPDTAVEWHDVTYGAGLWVAVGYHGNQEPSVMVSSDNGETWAISHITETPSSTDWGGIAFNGSLFAACGGNATMLHTILHYFLSSPITSYLTITKSCPTVADVQSGICLRAGLTASQFDVTALSSITRDVCSFIWPDTSPGRSPTETLMSLYFYELVMSGGKIKFVPRGGTPVVSIPYLDLGAHMEGSEQPEPLAPRLAADLEQPAQLALTYINILDDYQKDTQYSDRLSSATSNTILTAQVLVGMTPSEAKAVVDTWLLDRIISTITAPIDLLGDYCHLEPTDVFLVTGPDGSQLRMRFIEKTDNYPLLLHKAVLDDASVLISQGITSVDYTPQTIVAPPVDTLMRLLDIPILQDADDDTGFYVETKGDGTPYPGSAIFGSPNNVDFSLKTTIYESAVFGICTTTLGDWTGPRIFDELNRVTVNVGAGTLSSSTREAVEGDQSVNAYAIGVDGRWEVGQFVTATLVSAGIYTLSRLLRGSRGTGWAMIGHVAGEKFELLRAAGMRRIVLQNNELGLTRYYKGVTRGRLQSTATAESFINNAIGKKPFSPFDLRASRDGSNNIVFTWGRRTRRSVRMTGALGFSVPLGEETKAYELDIYADGTYTTIVDTLGPVDTETTPFTAAEQTAAGLTPGNIVYVGVRQISATVGRGYELRAAA